MDDTESSIDGSLENSIAPIPAIFFPNTPESMFNMDIMADQLQDNSINEDLSSSTYLADNILIATKIVSNLPNCDKISSYLLENGFHSLRLLTSDINQKEGSVTVFMVEAWAETVLSALIEMNDRAKAHQKALSNVARNARIGEVGKGNLESKIEELNNKLVESKQREKSALLKIKTIEDSQGSSVKQKINDNADLKRSLKSLETQVQEFERQLRVRDLEIDRLKQKLSHVAEKERDVNLRNRHILGQIGMGSDMSGNSSIISTNSNIPSSPIAAAATFTSPLNKTTTSANNNSGRKGTPGRRNSITATPSSISSRSSNTSKVGHGTGSTLQQQQQPTQPTIVSMTTVVDAMERQRSELCQRNNELEMQVKDLLTTLKKQQNDWDHYCSDNNSNRRRQRHQQQLNDSNDSISNDNNNISNDDDNDEDISSNSNINTKQLTPTAKKMYDQILHQEKIIVELRRQLEVSESVLAERVEVIAKQRDEINDLHEELENLQLQLDHRPTMKQWAQAQRDREELEQRLHDLVLLRGESAEIAMWRKHLSTSDRIKVDKRNHELGLWLLDSLPKTAMKEVLQSVCRELDISEISDIHPSLVKLKAVVKTIPRMERFISQVCSFIYQRHPTLGPIDGMKSSTSSSNQQQQQLEYTIDDILPILHRWWYAAQRCVELDEFHNRVLLELYRRQEILGRKSQYRNHSHENSSKNININKMDNGCDRFPQHLHSNVELTILRDNWEKQAKYQWACKDMESIFDIIRDLVDFQSEVMHHDQSLVYAEDYIRERPEIMVNRIVGHIQYLFEIKALDGVLPRLNQIYLFVEEMRNFMITMRAILCTHPGFSNEAAVSNAMILTEIQRRLTIRGNNS